jgi:hypothetical protein
MGVMSVAYTTINGEIVSEKRNGVPSDYIPDDLGSTIGLLSDTHQVIDTWTYWPYGEVRTHTGTSITPFTFVGTAGYHSDLVGNFTHVGARELRVALTRLQTVDSLWPPLLPCAYADCNPTSVIDPSGTNGFVASLPYILGGEATVPGLGEVCMAVTVACALTYLCYQATSTKPKPSAPPYVSGVPTIQQARDPYRAGGRRNPYPSPVPPMGPPRSPVPPVRHHLLLGQTKVTISALSAESGDAAKEYTHTTSTMSRISSVIVT